MTKRLFRQEHPFISGLLILGAVSLTFLVGIAFFISLLFSPSDENGLGSKEGIGIVDIKGVIVSPEETLKLLSRYRESDIVKAVVLRIDSPGGAVGASQEIFTEALRTAQGKPVVASMGSVAASGGYYAALGAQKIVASPGTLTGSMGVIIKFANLEELFSKIGYRSEVVKSGAMKDIGSPDRPLTDDEKELLQGLINNVHEQFVQAIAAARHLSEDDVRKLADGRILSGEQAHALGLIDQLGNFTDAVLLAAELAGLPSGEPHLIYPKEDDFSLVHLLFGKGSENFVNRAFMSMPALSYEWPGMRAGE